MQLRRRADRESANPWSNNENYVAEKVYCQTCAGLEYLTLS